MMRTGGRLTLFGLDYEALFANLSDDRQVREERIRRGYVPLHEKLAQTEPVTRAKRTLMLSMLGWI